MEFRCRQGGGDFGVFTDYPVPGRAAELGHVHVQGTCPAHWTNNLRGDRIDITNT